LNIGVGVQFCCSSLGFLNAVLILLVAFYFISFLIDQGWVAMNDRSSNASILDVLFGSVRLDRERIATATDLSI
jgi:hypothetical protein